MQAFKFPLFIIMISVALPEAAALADGFVNTKTEYAGTKGKQHNHSFEGEYSWKFDRKRHTTAPVQLGPRPFYLIDKMEKSDLKDALKACQNGPFYKTDFSIGHRGAALQFPEHTQESYEAAARMGAGIVECDVTFTKDKELVCRHSQCDLHTTTNILETDLAGKCSIPPDPNSPTPYADVECCTSDITLAEFKTLRGKMDAANPQAATLDEYMNATPKFRTDLYSANATLMTHKESIALFKKLKVKMTPELKSPSVPMPFHGFSQQDYAQKMLDEYKQAGVKAEDVYPQSFNLDDVLYWIQHEPAFGRQAVYLDGRDEDPAFDVTDPATWHPSMDELVDQGVKIIAPPMWMLVKAENGRIVPSIYAREAKAAGLDIIAWTFERAGLLTELTSDTYYYQTIYEIIHSEGDKMVLLDVLAKQVGILGIFSDWAAPVTYYANCMNIK